MMLGEEGVHIEINTTNANLPTLWEPCFRVAVPVVARCIGVGQPL